MSDNKFSEKSTLKNYVGCYLLIFCIFCFSCPILTYYNVMDNFIRSVIYISFSGAIGALLYAIRGFYQNIANDNFQDKWCWWYIFRPIIGFIAGIFIYFILGGLIGLTTSNINLTATGIMGYCGLAFLAGFGFTQFADKLYDINKVLI